MRNAAAFNFPIAFLTLLLAGCALRSAAGPHVAPAAGYAHEAASAGQVLPGFSPSPYFAEQTRSFTFDPNVAVHVNAPPPHVFNPARPTLLTVYALPNGNTIAQTIGCKQAPGLDWHFYIQHIGAQTRWLRARQPDRNLVVAYVEAGGRSWPTWRQKHADAGVRIVALLDELRALFPSEDTRVALTGHSGGGSLIFGFISHVDEIPDWIERIVFLDANYGYSDDDRHAEKLLRWLQRSPRHCLGVVAYDDREIEVNGKKVVGPTGGTWRKTQAMAARLKALLTETPNLPPLAETDLPDRLRWSGLDGRLDLVLFKNPENRILHTVLVERNGFIHALKFGGSPATQPVRPATQPAADLMGPPVYGGFVQAGSAMRRRRAGGRWGFRTRRLDSSLRSE